MSQSLVVAQSSFPTPQEITMLKELGTMAVKSGFLPVSIKTPEQAVIIMLKGRELGIPPMQAFGSIAVVSGKPTISAELMISLIYQRIPGAVIDVLETSSNTCAIEAKRPGGKRTKFEFTMEDAKRANLAGKGPWVTYPAAMLRARCISAMARMMFADALSGACYTAEELGAEVTDEGEVITLPSAPTGSNTQPPNTEVKPPTVAITPPLTTLNRAQLGQKIDEIAQAINLKEEDMLEWIFDLYKKPMSQMTQKEMIDFHGVLEGEKLAKQEKLL